MHMKGLFNEKEAGYMGYFISAVFLVIHLSLLILFRKYNVTPMAYFNIFSIIFYIFCFYILKKEKFKLFVTLTFIEVFVHMCSATYFVGWDSGFQITLIGINIMAFFAEYVGRILNYDYAYGLPFSIFNMIGYVSMYLVAYNKEPMYPLPDSVSFYLHIVWAVVTFVISIIFLQVFVLLTFKSEVLLSKVAGHDELTGLGNRFSANIDLKNTFTENSEKNYVALIDIDDFKKINDTYGHNYGDYVLKTIANIFCQLPRPTANALEVGACNCPVV